MWCKKRIQSIDVIGQMQMFLLPEIVDCLFHHTAYTESINVEHCIRLDSQLSDNLLFSRIKISKSYVHYVSWFQARLKPFKGLKECVTLLIRI